MWWNSKDTLLYFAVVRDGPTYNSVCVCVPLKVKGTWIVPGFNLTNCTRRAILPACHDQLSQKTIKGWSWSPPLCWPFSALTRLSFFLYQNETSAVRQNHSTWPFFVCSPQSKIGKCSTIVCSNVVCTHSYHFCLYLFLSSLLPVTVFDLLTFFFAAACTCVLLRHWLTLNWASPDNCTVKEKVLRLHERGH